MPLRDYEALDEDDFYGQGFGPISYSKSFLKAVVRAAKRRGITECWWVFVQFDFAYDPKRVKRAIASQPVFLGVFKYVAEDEPLE
jgi:hypothetical protein